MSMWPELRKTDWLLSIGDGSYLFQKYWTEIFDLTHANKINSWAYRWLFSCWAQNGLTILPSANLVTNVGFGEQATHTADKNSILSDLPLEEIEFPLAHPKGMVRDIYADKWEDQHVYCITKLSHVKNLIKSVPVVGQLSRLYKIIRS